MSLAEKPRKATRPFWPEANGAFRTSFAQLALMARITRVEPGTLATGWRSLATCWFSPRNCNHESWLNNVKYGDIWENLFQNIPNIWENTWKYLLWSSAALNFGLFSGMSSWYELQTTQLYATRDAPPVSKVAEPITSCFSGSIPSGKFHNKTWWTEGCSLGHGDMIHCCNCTILYPTMLQFLLWREWTSNPCMTTHIHKLWLIHWGTGELNGCTIKCQVCCLPSNKRGVEISWVFPMPLHLREWCFQHRNQRLVLSHGPGSCNLLRQHNRHLTYTRPPPENRCLMMVDVHHAHENSVSKLVWHGEKVQHVETICHFGIKCYSKHQDFQTTTMSIATTSHD